MHVNQEVIFMVGLFGTVSLLIYWLTGVLFSKNEDPRIRRLREHDPEHATEHRSSRQVLAPVMSRMGEAAARPFMPKNSETQSNLRKQLSHAGLYTASAMQLLVGAKVIMLFGGALIGYLTGLYFGGIATWILLYVGAVVGYLIPAFWLKFKISSRRHALERALPDALDLMVVCVEAGLTLDASLQRVGNEIAMAHPDISREFGITHMETRVGLARIDALRNLGQRTGSPALQSLAAMLVQTERFGTSIAQALRVHADSLRIKRQHMAEEAAAKTTVKLAFPVVLFIFPVLILVLGGPAFITFAAAFSGK
jgi:tight adherence protein C